MKKNIPLFISLLIISCSMNQEKTNSKNQTEMTQSDIKNEILKEYSFLKDMYDDSYFPNFLVDKGKMILIALCIQIEEEKPKNLAELYKLTHAATNKFNDLEDEFGENGSEIETGARESIGSDFYFIAKAYGYNANIEELIGTRNW